MPYVKGQLSPRERLRLKNYLKVCLRWIKDQNMGLLTLSPGPSSGISWGHWKYLGAPLPWGCWTEGHGLLDGFSRAVLEAGGWTRWSTALGYSWAGGKEENRKGSPCCTASCWHKTPVISPFTGYSLFIWACFIFFLPSISMDSLWSP